MQAKIFITLSLCLFIFSCNSMSPQMKESQPINHDKFDALLKKHVNKEGMVDYSSFISDSVALAGYIKSLENNLPNDEKWSKDEQLTFWVNAYNAVTIQVILRHYPVKSIRDIGSIIRIPFVNSAWDIKIFSTPEGLITLNNIEHNIIRKNFDEPRIHFALVCAAKSCPKLRNEAYNSTKLNDQLTQQTRSFLANNSKNQLKTDRIKLSKIFSWFTGDFTKKMSLIEYLNQYSSVKIDDNAKRAYMDYDWSLNEQ